MIPVINLPKFIVEYPVLKQRVSKNSLILNAVAIISLLLINPLWAFHYAEGAVLGYGYLWSLFFSTEFPERRLSVFLSVARTFFAAFLIVAMGQFKVLTIGVVFCGFLSYKLWLILEIVRISVGKEFNSGK